MMAYIKSLFYFGYRWNLHLLAGAIYDDWREPFDSPEAFTGAVSKGVPVRPPYMHHWRAMVSTLGLSMLLYVAVNLSDPVAGLLSYGVDCNFPGRVFDSSLPPEG